MLALLSKTWRLLLIPLAALVFFVAAYSFFYRDYYDPPPAVNIPYERIGLPASQIRDFTEVPTIREGLFLLDGAHGNRFSKEEISVLLSRVADRGYDIEFIGSESPFGGFISLDLRDRLPLLEEKLRGADSFVVILPTDSYVRAELDIIERFVEKGGKLLLLGDPTRDSEINSLGERFGIAFQPDYLYNMVDYDINFQHVILNSFRPDEITASLEQIVLYTAGSIKSSGAGLAFTDGNTRSSMVERIEPFYPIVKERNGKVLAISDVTFIIPPQNSILDNDRFISNIADYLTQSRREFELADFPHFFQKEVDILLGRSDIFDIGAALKNTLSSFQIDSEIRSVEDLTKDTIFIGLYQDSGRVAQYLGISGIRIDDTLRTPFTPAITTDGTGIVMLHKTQDRHVLTILGTSPSSLVNMILNPQDGRFRSGLVSEFLGVYKNP